MFYVSYRSSRPFDHLPRTLDALRRMGFELHRLMLDSSQADTSRIEVTYQPLGHLNPSTFVERLRGMPGVNDVTAGPVSGPADSEIDKGALGIMA